MPLIEWEADWAESSTALMAGMVVAAVVVVLALIVMKWKAGKEKAKA